MLDLFLKYNKPCDICLDEKCAGTHTCNCSTCKSLKECPKFLRATIRITNKCTQTCSHCCFNSSPNSNTMMTIEMAEKIGLFIKNNNIFDINLMGGEFFCNKNWFEILSILINHTKIMRLVTNGDWAANTEITDKVIEFISLHKDQLRIAISKDKWHSNKNIEKAEAFLKDVNALYHVATEEETKDESIIPIGRSELIYSPFYSSFSCYCHNIEKQYSFLIDEKGDIYKCSFGVWKYDNIQNFIEGGFNKRFKEFNKKFYSLFIPSCKRCINACEKEYRVSTD